MITISFSVRVLTLASALLSGGSAVSQTAPADPTRPPPTALPTPAPADKPLITPPADPLAPAPTPAPTPLVSPAPKPAPKAAEKAAPKKTDTSAQFSGKVTNADKVNYTLTISKGRVLHITSQTRLFKGSKPAVFDDAAVGEEISGQFRKGAGGAMEAVTIHIGAKPVAPTAGKKKSDDKKPAEKSPGDLPAPEKK